MQRLQAAGLILLLLLAPAWPARASRDVTDYGRTPQRNHYTAEEPGYPLCLLLKLPLGQSRSQPLIVRRDVDGDGREELRIYHMMGDSLFAFDGGQLNPSPPDPALDREQQIARWQAEGFIKARIRLQPGYSASQLAYWRSSRPGGDLVVAGTGQRAVVVLRAGDLAPVQPPVTIPEPADPYADCNGQVIRTFRDHGIVAAPLLLADPHNPGQPLVVIGTTEGEVWIIRGVGRSPQVSRRCVGGRISSSPVPLGGAAFVIASDGRAEGGRAEFGYVMAYRVADPRTGEMIVPYWQEPLFTPRGVPGEVAIDMTQIYFADKGGVLYAAALETGIPVWAPARVDGFINMGPGINADYAFFASRDPAGGPGHLYAVRKRTGEVVTGYTATLPGGGNTAPVPLAALGPGLAPGLVLVGDTAGHVTGWRDGQPAEFAIPAACQDLAGRRGDLPPVAADLRLTDQPYRAGEFWDPINGTGTQMVVAYDLMLLGVNSYRPEDNGLQVYRLLPAVNFRLAGRLKGQPPQAVGAPVPVELTVTPSVNQDVASVPLVVGWAVNGRVERAYRYDSPPFARNADRPWTVTVSLPLPASGAEFWAAVNPEALRRDPRGAPLPDGLWAGGPYTDPALAYEVKLDDNIYRVTVAVAPPGGGGGGGGGSQPPGGGGGGQGPPGGGLPPPPPRADLSVDWLSAPASAPVGGFGIALQVSNNGAGAQRAMLQVQAEQAMLLYQPVDLAAQESRRFNLWTPPWPAGAVIRVVAVIDPDNRVAEDDETNNRREAVTIIEKTPPPPEVPPPQDWGSRLSN